MGYVIHTLAHTPLFPPFHSITLSYSIHYIISVRPHSVVVYPGVGSFDPTSRLTTVSLSLEKSSIPRFIFFFFFLIFRERSPADVLSANVASELNTVYASTSVQMKCQKWFFFQNFNIVELYSEMEVNRAPHPRTSPHDYEHHLHCCPLRPAGAERHIVPAAVRFGEGVGKNIYHLLLRYYISLVFLFLPLSMSYPNSGTSVPVQLLSECAEQRATVAREVTPFFF